MRIETQKIPSVQPIDIARTGEPQSQKDQPITPNIEQRIINLLDELLLSLDQDEDLE